MRNALQRTGATRHLPFTGLSLLLAASDFREAQVVRKVTEVFRERLPPNWERFGFRATGVFNITFSNGVHVRLTLRAQKFIPAM